MAICYLCQEEGLPAFFETSNRLRSHRRNQCPVIKKRKMRDQVELREFRVWHDLNPPQAAQDSKVVPAEMEEDKEKLKAMALQIDDLQGELRLMKAEYQSKVLENEALQSQLKVATGTASLECEAAGVCEVKDGESTKAEKGDDKEGKQLLQKFMGKDLPYEFQLKNTVRPELVAEVPKKQKSKPRRLPPVPPFPKVKTKKKESLNVIFLGHESSGKSLLIGKLLQKTKTKKDMLNIYQTEGQGYFETRTKYFYMQDGPIPKATATRQNYKGDVAVLVVSGKRDEFNLGFKLGDKVETDITSISKSKVKQMVVVVSKMDESGVNWAEKRFTQIVDKLTKVLQKRGYDPACGNCQFLPVASFNFLGLSLPTGSSADWNMEEPLISYLDKLNGRHSFMSDGEEGEQEEEHDVKKKIKLEDPSCLEKIVDPQMGSPLPPGVLSNKRISTPNKKYQQYQEDLKRSEETKASDIFDFK